MTSRDYARFAAFIRMQVKDPVKKEDIIHLCSQVFADDNPLFSEDKFREACGGSNFHIGQCTGCGHRGQDLENHLCSRCHQ